MKATLDLMAAADARGVKAFIHTSTAGTIGKHENGEAGDEDTPASPKQLRNLYFKSKVDGDAKIRAYEPPNGMAVVQVLPGWMWGPGDAGPTPAGQIVFDFLDGKFPAVPEGGSMMADARDVAAVMVRAVDKPHGARFIIGGHYHSLREVVDLVARETGRPAPKANLPSWLAIGYAYMSEAWASLTGGRAAANLDGVRMMAAKLNVSSAKAERELGATFRPLDDTIHDVIAWYDQQGMLPHGAVGVADGGGAAGKRSP